MPRPSPRASATAPPPEHDAPSRRRLNAIFAALADPIRRDILARLARGEACVMELALPFRVSQPAISKHLAVLERAGLISRRREAQRRRCRLEANPLAEAAQWIESHRRIWEANFQHLDAVLEELKAAHPPATRRRKTPPKP